MEVVIGYFFGGGNADIASGVEGIVLGFDSVEGCDLTETWDVCVNRIFAKDFVKFLFSFFTAEGEVGFFASI